MSFECCCCRNDEESDSSSYDEWLYCHLLDRERTNLTYAQLSSRVSKSSTLDVLFDRAVYVQRNREYRICVVLNRRGYYRLSTTSLDAVAHGVHFRFGASNVSAVSSTELSSVDIRGCFTLGVIFSL
jgi:hypothetical protein